MAHAKMNKTELFVLVKSEHYDGLIGSLAFLFLGIYLEQLYEVTKQKSLGIDCLRLSGKLIVIYIPFRWHVGRWSI